PSTALSTPSLHDALPICDDLQYLQENKHRRRIGSKGLKEFRQSITVGVDALEIIEIFSGRGKSAKGPRNIATEKEQQDDQHDKEDRKSTRLNSSHVAISY